jgi:uncharacterized protein DUF1656
LAGGDCGLNESRALRLSFGQLQVHVTTPFMVLVAPFVIYGGTAIAILAALRPLLHLVGFNRAFNNPAIAELSLYVLSLALLIVLF